MSRSFLFLNVVRNILPYVTRVVVLLTGLLCIATHQLNRIVPGTRSKGSSHNHPVTLGNMMIHAIIDIHAKFSFDTDEGFDAITARVTIAQCRVLGKSESGSQTRCLANSLGDAL